MTGDLLKREAESCPQLESELRNEIYRIDGLRIEAERELRNAYAVIDDLNIGLEEERNRLSTELEATERELYSLAQELDWMGQEWYQCMMDLEQCTQGWIYLSDSNICIITME